MKTMDWLLLLFLVILAFISWHKSKVKRCQQLGCSTCRRNANLCPHRKKDSNKGAPHSTE